MAPGSQVVTNYYDAGGPLAGARGARLPPGGLRLHHLHRQLGSAGLGDLRGHPGQRPRRHRGAVGQPQLRGPHQPGREDELPGLAAAGHRLRAGGHHGLRLRERARGAGQGRPATSTWRDIWPNPTEVEKVIGASISTEMFTEDYRTSSTGDERWRALETPEGATFEWDAESTYVRKPPYFEGMERAARAGQPTSRAPGCWSSSATRSPPTTSRPPAPSSSTPRQASTCRSTASSARTSTPTAPAAATTRS